MSLASPYSLYLPDSNSFPGIGLADDDRERCIGPVHYADEPLAQRWVPPVVRVFRVGRKRDGDFPSLSDKYVIPVMSGRAWEVLRPLIGYCCEALPIVHPSGKPFFLIHVMETIDCLDQERSEVSRLPSTGMIADIECYALKTDMLRGKHIFKLPLMSGADLIVDEDFRQVVESNGLQGLNLKPLPLAP